MVIQNYYATKILYMGSARNRPTAKGIDMYVP